MRHLLICPEFPPAPGGGIGTYADTLAGFLAAQGEFVHVVALAARGVRRLESRHEGRLVIHRLPWRPQLRAARDALGLPFRPKPFVWQAAKLAEALIERERIDVVEAQEYQAPLFALQLRRALGLGPTRKPPCVVHLHAPTRLIARHDGWRPRRHLRETMRMESYSVRAADLVLAPSRALARWAESRYRLRQPVAVVPYPVAPAQPIPRTEATWARGTICYVGRLETRKGVFEWTEAAARAAEGHAGARFHFAGGDSKTEGGGSVRRALLRRIPAAYADRFHFAGALPREAVPRFLGRARIAVVPSRWENYPYACLEAMRSGLPVLGTRTGGLAELIQPGRNGWLAEPGDAEDLHRALCDALAASPTVLAEMGARAARDVARLCDPGRILARHVELKASASYAGNETRVRPPRGWPAAWVGPVGAPEPRPADA
jgi:glycosyltransferase involved in cell wall biosynthesis